MTIKDNFKDSICRMYDEDLDKKVPVGVLLHGNMSPSLINFSNYDANARSKHLSNAFRIAKLINVKYPVISKSDAMDYIMNPDFEISTDVINGAFGSGLRSLENSYLYRYVYEQVLVEPLQKRPCGDFKRKEMVMPLTKITRIDLGNDLYYYREDILFIHEYVFKALFNHFLVEFESKKNFANENANFKQKALVETWDTLFDMGYEVYRIFMPNTYIKKNKFHKLFLTRHTMDFDENDFVFKEKVAFDNRKHLKDENNQLKTLSLCGQRVNYIESD